MRVKYMRVKYDVCGVVPAAELCCADDAELCDASNRRVHCANKLAGKHRRLTLLHPTGGAAAAAAAPLCDVCKEQRGLVSWVHLAGLLDENCWTYDHRRSQQCLLPS